MEKLKTRDVLKVLGLSTIIVGSVIIPNLPMAISPLVKAWKNYNRVDLGKIIKRLQKQEMLSIKEIDGKTVIEITDKGKRRLLEYDFENIQLKAKKRDGKWRLIIFDIPEKYKSSRELFRRKLLQVGCVRLQDSVFVSAFPCKDEINFICNLMGISDYVTLIKVDKIERGEELMFKGVSQKYLDYIGYYE